jgi:hypothetical protein
MKIVSTFVALTIYKTNSKKDMCQEVEIKKIPTPTKVVAARCGVSLQYVRMIQSGARRVRSKKSRAVVAEINRIAKLLELSEI